MNGEQRTESSADSASHCVLVTSDFCLKLLASLAPSSYMPARHDLTGDMSLRETLYIVVFENHTPAGQAFDVALLICITLSVTLTMLETVHAYWERYSQLFRTAEVMFTSIFAIEYLLRVAIARPGAASYMCSFFGIVDLFAVLPTLLDELLAGSGTAYLRIVRVLRLLRVFRVLHFAGLTAESDALKAALWAARRKIAVFLVTILLVVVVMGTIIYIVEDNRNSGFTSIPRSIYWAIVTLTTVGYGDIAPQTVAGQAIASLMMVAGYAIMVVPTGLAAAEYTLAQSSQRPRAGRRRDRTLARAFDPASVHAPVEQRACSNCEGTGHDENASYCKFCGTELRSDSYF